MKNLFPAITFLLLVLIFSLTFCSPKADRIKELEKSEAYWRKVADSLKDRVKIKVDTFYVTTEKIKIKNKLIYVKQDIIMDLPFDSASSYLSKWSKEPVIKD